MIVGQNTFIRIRNQYGKTSAHPVAFLSSLRDVGIDLFNVAGEPLIIVDLGVRPAVEIQVKGPIPRFVHKRRAHLVLGPDEMIQGVRARDLFGENAQHAGRMLKSIEGDAYIKRVRGNTDRSPFEDHVYNVNAVGDVHGILIE